MAQPISFQPHQAVPPERRLENARTEHAEAILSAYELLQLLHDRGVLDFARGLAGAGNQLVDTLTAAADAPESVRALRNFLLLTKFFGNIHPDALASLARAVTDGSSWEKAHKAPGFWQLLWRLRRPDSRHAMAIGLDLLEAAGKGL